MEIHNNYKLNFIDRKDFDFSKLYSHSSFIMTDAALKRGLNVEPLFNKYIKISNKNKSILFHAMDSGPMSRIITDISEDKEMTKYFLNKAGIYTPKGAVFSGNDTKGITEYCNKLENFVIKPNDGDCGENVYMGLKHSSVSNIIENNFNKNDKILVEEHIKGDEYRIFAIENGYTATVFRRPASILGDGNKNLLDLIDEKNIDRKNGFTDKNGSPFTEIKVDNPMREFLRERNMEIDYTPEKGERIFLRGNSNLSTGGDAISIPLEEVHPKFREIAVNSIRALPGFLHGGVDIITEDIRNFNGKYAVLELNNVPGIKGLHYPFLGPSQDPTGAVLDYFFKKF